MNSVWSESVNMIKNEALKKNIKTDVLIIGGGIAGILCTYLLKNNGVDCVLVEANRICSGITKNTTAKITLQHGLIYDELIKKYGIEKAKLYYEINDKACKEFEKLCLNIPCDYEKKDSYVYSLDDRGKIEKEVKALDCIGVKADFCEKISLPFDVAGAVRIRNQAQFHPLKFLNGLSGNLPIYENTKVLELMPHKAITQYGEISCKKIIVATHFPVLNKHGAYSLKMYQHRSYVTALENAGQLDGMFVDEKDKGMSFRNYKNLLFVGGGDHRTGKSGGNWKELEEFSSLYYPHARIMYKWASQDCMTLDGIPYIGRYSKDSEDLYVATGFNKWGMTSSFAAAMILSDMVSDRENRYSEVFEPSRKLYLPQLFVNAFESCVGFLTPAAPRCPHLGCALKYNKDEHSWDCPCHGSRFTENGQLIDNPATDDKKM